MLRPTVQSARPSWNKAPIWGLRPDLYYCQTDAGLLMWGALSDERMVSVVCSCGWPSPAQSFSGPSPVGLVTIFYCLRFETSLFVVSYDSQDHGGGIRNRIHTGAHGFKVKVTLRLTVSQLVSLGVEPHLGLMTRYLLLIDNYGLIFLGRPLWREDGSVFCICCCSSPAQSFLG
jgi:hypothetical protein